MINIEHRSLFQLLQNLRPRDAEGLGKRRPDASRLRTRPRWLPTPPALRSRHVSENLVLSPNNGTREHGDIKLRDQLHLAARQQEIHCLDQCLLGACLLVTSVSLVASWITMHGHLTCPEIFWHVSDTRIGTISKPVHESQTIMPKIQNV